jgi:peptidoglycan/LPS O-acetylase OafA/YrhL
MPEKRHFYWLDWIRFFAAFMVVTCHARSGNWVEWGRLGAGHHSRLILAFFTGTRAGVEWVMVFFVLSGFLVGGMALERSLNRTFDFWAFAWDRVSRIWVPLVPALVLTVGIQLYCGVRVSVPLLLGNLFALQGVICNPIGENFPLWSLSYEVWFYVLTGIAALIVTGLARRSIVWVALAVCFVVFTKLSVSYLNCWSAERSPQPGAGLKLKPREPRWHPSRIRCI